jgi:hypothetical protein
MTQKEYREKFSLICRKLKREEIQFITDYITDECCREFLEQYPRPSMPDQERCDVDAYIKEGLL